MPIEDPSFAARRREVEAKEAAAAERGGRMEYVKPLVMLVVGAGVVMGITAVNNGTEEVGGALLAALYPVGLAIELVFGVVGLIIACRLWIGGAGPVGLAILRLAGIYAVTDVVAILSEGLMFLSWLIQAVVYVCLLAWLFELEVSESIILALITWILKVAAGFMLVILLSSSM